MSRVAKNPVLIPDNVKLAVENNKVIVEGPKGKDELTKIKIFLLFKKIAVSQLNTMKVLALR